MAQNKAVSSPLKWEILVTSAVLLLVLFTITGKAPDDRRRTYDTVPEEGGPYPYFSRMIFDDPKPLDVAILGSSLELVSLNPRSIEIELEKRLGREVQIGLFASNWRSEDLLYLLARDLLDHRKVGTILIGMPHYGATRADPHPLASYWWPLSEVSAKSEPGVIALAAAGLPRRMLLSIFPPKRVRPRLSPSFRGGLELELGFMGKPFSKVPGAATAASLPASDTLHTVGSPEIKKPGTPLNEFQKTYLRKILKVAAARQTRVALLHIPVHEARPAEYLETRSNIDEVFPKDTPYIGISPLKFWSVRPEHSEIDQFYYDDHMNANGNAFFSHEIVSAFEVLLR